MLYKRRRERNREEKKVTEIIKITIGTKLITNTKKQKLKIQSRVWNFENTMLKKRRKKKKGQKIIKYIYMKFAEEEKNRVFFFFFAK